MSNEFSSPAKSRDRRRRWLVVLAVALLIAATAVLVVVLRSDQGQQGAAPPDVPTTSAGTTSPNTTSPPGTSPSTTHQSTTTATVPVFSYKYLWPFEDLAQAENWLRSYREGGHQPWHRDPVMTAQSFTQGYLGYAGIDRVTSQQLSGRQAWVGVGYSLPNGRAATAAVIHLLKLGTADDAPWEVVGTRDTDLTLTLPKYGSTVTSPVTVGGRVSGVDENLQVEIREPQGQLAGKSAGLPAGGMNTPWSAQVVFTAPAGKVLTVTVSTGGHVAQVERFAITGVVTGPGKQG